MASAIWTEAGHAYTVDLLDPNTRTAQAVSTYYLGWGSSTAPLAVTDSSLTEHPETRVAATSAQQDTDGNALDDYWRLTAQIQAFGTRSVAEAGFFTTVTKGAPDERMLLRMTFPAIPIESGDRLEADIALHLTDSSETP